MTETGSSSLSSFLTEAAWERLAERLSLSPREAQIVQAVLEDQKESAIARQLKMSPHTVHTHLERLYVKLSVHSRPELILKIVTAFLSMTSELDSPLPAICADRTSGNVP